MKCRNFDSIWCYSIYGDNTFKYYEPMRENIRIARERGIALIVHTNCQYEERVRNFFSEFKDDIIISVHKETFADSFPKILRFLTYDEVKSKFYFYKDSDSIVTPEELEIMDQWSSLDDSEALIIRDHPLHISPILAGMFATNHAVASQVSHFAKRFFIDNVPKRYRSHSYDQDWLAKDIYPLIAQKATIITSFFYFSNERIERKKCDNGSYQHIGAQAYKREGSTPDESERYLKLYRGELLCVPYYPSLHFLYGRVRPTLAVAWLLSMLKRMIPHPK